MQNVNDDLQQRWWNLEAKLAERFGKKPDMEAILFLIGMQETNFMKGQDHKRTKTRSYACSCMHCTFAKWVVCIRRS
jgi:hypothetical protein